MNKLLKLTTFILALATLSTIASAATYTDVPETNKYFDVIEKITEKGIVNGYDNGTFKPNDLINRAELLKIVTEGAAGLSNWMDLNSYAIGKCGFSDVNTTSTPIDWFASYVCYGYEQEIILGYENNNGGNPLFKPAQDITYVEGLKIMLFSFGFEVEASTPWYQSIYDFAEDNNLMPSTISKPDQKITRGEMAEMIAGVLKLESELDEPADIYGDFDLVEDMENLWGYDYTYGKAPEYQCSAAETFGTAQSHIEDGGNYKEIKETINGVNVHYILRDGISSNSAEFVGTKDLVRVWVENIGHYLGNYPCNDLYIEVGDGEYNTYWEVNYIYLSEEDMNDVYWVLSLLTRTAFTRDYYEDWYGHGVYRTLDNLMMQDFAGEVDFKQEDTKIKFDNGKFDLETAYNVYNSSSEQDYFNSNFYQNTYGGATTCELEDGFVNFPYWNEVFMIDLMESFDREAVVNAWRAIYEKYRYKSVKDFETEDFVDAVNYYMEKANHSESEVEEMEAFMKSKLCL